MGNVCSRRFLLNRKENKGLLIENDFLRESFPLYELKIMGPTDYYEYPIVLIRILIIRILIL